MKHVLPELPYSFDALGEKMSKETFEFHYGKHHQTYIDNLNKMIAGTPFEDMPLEDIIRKAEGGIFNNAAQTWNHTFFFTELTPDPVEMPAELKARIEKDFGSVEAFKEAFIKAAVSLFGSGWAWLVEDKDGKLSIMQTSNAGNPMTLGMKPIMTVDVWEHAYYIDYRNKRQPYVENCLNLMNWKKIAERL